ncbi:MAG: carboxymuconolactone decarboxylase family protein [Candidatus Aminicenantes bacterium]|jgi:AhpD family alkylhydroperoxidase
MSLTVKEKELVNIGASVATGCKPCTNYHFKKVREAGASDEEIKDAITFAMLVRDSAKEIMENYGLQQMDIAKKEDDSEYIEGTTRIKELVSVAAAYAVNCTTNLKKHMDAARAVGITEGEIEAVLHAASFIQGEAAYYVDQIVKLKRKSDELEKLLDELKATQAQLVQSEKMAGLGKVVAGFVHELNTPIGAIKGAVDVYARSISNIQSLLEESQSIDEIKRSDQLQKSIKSLEDNINVTVAASERIANITDSLKSFARLDESAFQKACIHEGLDSALTLLESETKERIKIEKDYGSVPMIYCYPGELNQVFMHLLTNAAEAIRGKGTIRIRTFVDDENVHVEITDTGIGILPDQKDGIFEPNFRKDGSRVKAGLGLFTSYNIVQNHKGHIEVESDVGKGSTFRVILPKDFNKKEYRKLEGEPASPAHRCEQMEKAESSAHLCEQLEKEEAKSSDHRCAQMEKEEKK